jgi:single-strand DNA-binding protein
VSSLNKIILIGNLTENPEQRTTTAGESFSRFTLAIDRPTGPDGMSLTTDFLPVVAWRELAQQTQNMQKGDRALVEGRIVTRTFDDEDGKRHYITEVEARLLQAVSGVSSSLPRTADPAPSSFVKPSVPPVPVQELPVLETKPVQSVLDDEFDFGSELPASFTEEIEEDIPF